MGYVGVAEEFKTEVVYFKTDVCMKSRLYFKSGIRKRTFIDSRFINIVRFLSSKNLNSAIYLVRLISGFGLTPSKNYINKIDKIYDRSKNKLQSFTL